MNQWQQLMNSLDYLRNELNMGTILIGHVTVKLFTDPTGDNYDQYTLDLNKHAVSGLMRWADSILFANIRAAVKKEDKGFNQTSKKAVMRDERILFTQKRPAHPGGGRGVYGHIPHELPLEYSAFAEAVKNVM
jgi:hypothetical protein